MRTQRVTQQLKEILNIWNEQAGRQGNSGAGQRRLERFWHDLFLSGHRRPTYLLRGTAAQLPTHITPLRNLRAACSGPAISGHCTACQHIGSALTAIGDDYGYEHVLAHELTCPCPAGRGTATISPSGNRTNILRAIKAARRR